jgi:hypothetical protein
MILALIFVCYYFSRDRGVRYNLPPIFINVIEAPLNVEYYIDVDKTQCEIDIINELIYVERFLGFSGVDVITEKISLHVIGIVDNNILIDTNPYIGEKFIIFDVYRISDYIW